MMFAVTDGFVGREACSTFLIDTMLSPDVN